MTFFPLLRSLLIWLIFWHLPGDYRIIKHSYPSLFFAFFFLFGNVFLKLKWERIYLPKISRLFPLLFNSYVLKAAQCWSFRMWRAAATERRGDEGEALCGRRWIAPLWGAQYLAAAQRGSVSLLAGKLMRVVRAGGWKKPGAKPLLFAKLGWTGTEGGRAFQSFAGEVEEWGES